MSKAPAYWKKSLAHRGGFLLQVAIVLFWAAMMGLLVEKSFIRPEAPRFSPALAREWMKTGEEWRGIYLGKEKIGYAVTAKQQEGKLVSVKEQAWLKLTMLGIPQNIEQTLEYRTNNNLALESFDFALRSGLLQFRLVGRVEDCPAKAGKCLRLQVHSGGKEHQQEIALQEIPYLFGQTKPYFFSQGLEKGKKYRIPVFDPSTLSTVEMIAEVEGTERLSIGGEEKELYRVREELRGIVVKSWMDSRGEIWKEESPLGLVLLRENKNEAISKNWGRGKAADLIAMTAIPVNREIQNPRSTRYLRARLLSPALKDLKIEGGRQSRVGNVVIVRQEEFPPKPSTLQPFSEEARREALRSTPFIQSDDPEIKRRAAAIVGGIQDPAEKVRRIAAWVYGEIEKRPVLSIPSAVEVLRQKVGDCNEHAVLFTALVRSAGIPAHMQAGIIYQGGKFFYHAWAVVNLGAWVSVDPLLNQIPADATHIHLVEGDLDKQLEIVKVIGRLQVEVLEAR